MIEKFGVSVLFCTIWLSTGCRSQSTPIVPLNKSPNATASSTIPRVFSVVGGSSSWLYLKTAGAGTIHRLTDRKSGWETDGVLSLMEMLSRMRWRKDPKQSQRFGCRESMAAMPIAYQILKKML
ncbi:hypothetical protein [Tunturiibacter gelidiferens]|uniref:hypothetical protein n=1 Tax=Tunturiibacter gelidiferens TaxID=3069689 RepID=UPI003D9BABD5